MEAPEDTDSNKINVSYAKVEINAVPLIVAATTSKVKFFWLIILLGLTVAYLWSTVVQVKTYAALPVVTTKTVIPQVSLPVPKVLICPFDFLRHKDADILPISTIYSQFFDMPHYKTLEGTELNITFRKYYNKIMKMSFKTEEIFIMCKLGGRNISCLENVEKVILSESGVCYAFYTNQTQEDPTKGLKFYLHIYSRDSFAMYPFDGVSVRAYPHFPLFSSAILVDVGQYMKIDLQLRRNKILNTERQRCKNNKKPQKMTPGLDPDYVSLEVCQQYCKRQAAKKYCHCISFVHAGMVNYDEAELPVCTLLKLDNCYNDVIRQEISNCSKGCLPMCETWDVQAQENSISLKSEQGFLQKLNNQSGRLIVLDIAYTRLEIETIEQSFAISIQTLISNVGGLAGWWLGASVLTLMQLVMLALSAMKRRNRKDTSTNLTSMA